MPGSAVSANHVRAYSKKTEEQRTKLDQLILELLDLVLQDPVCMLREEGDDMLELFATSAHTSADAATARLTTYSHLAVIDRVEMLERIEGPGLSPHQRQITSCHAIRLLTTADGS